MGLFFVYPGARLKSDEACKTPPDAYTERGNTSKNYFEGSPSLPCNNTAGQKDPYRTGAKSAMKHTRRHTRRCAIRMAPTEL